VAASNALLDRGYGKAVQRQEHTGADGGPIQQQVVADGRVSIDAFLAEFKAGQAAETKH
jgi:hypothetical protein